MEMSQDTKDIFSAFVNMQSSLGKALKSGASTKYKYATLSDCMDTAKEPLSSNDLAVTQLISKTQEGTTLITMLLHSSGQWFRSEFLIKEAVLYGTEGKNPAQVMGSSITYMRRYAYCAMLGITQADDDATGNSYTNQNQQQPVYEQPQPQPIVEDLITPNQIKKLCACMKEAGVTDEEIYERAGVSSKKDIPKSMFNKIIAWLEKKEQQNNQPQQA